MPLGILPSPAGEGAIPGRIIPSPADETTASEKCVPQHFETMDASLVEGKGNEQKGGKEGGQILGMTCATPQNSNN